MGCVIVLVAAAAAHSVALVGFGLDSVIEIFASVVVVWQLTNADRERERLALRLIGFAFVCLALYIAGQSAYALLFGKHPAPSPLGIMWLTATLVAMLLLSYGKRITGKQLGNPVLTTEASVTLIDAYLAAAVLGGLLLNTSLGWWWTDVLAGLVIVYYGAREGLHAWREAPHQLRTRESISTQDQAENLGT